MTIPVLGEGVLGQSVGQPPFPACHHSLPAPAPPNEAKQTSFSYASWWRQARDGRHTKRKPGRRRAAETCGQCGSGETDWTAAGSRFAGHQLTRQSGSGILDSSVAYTRHSRLCCPAESCSTSRPFRAQLAAFATPAGPYERWLVDTSKATADFGGHAAGTCHKAREVSCGCCTRLAYTSDTWQCLIFSEHSQCSRALRSLNRHW